MLKTFTDEERAALKAEAHKRFQGRVIGVHMDDPISETIAVAPFDRASFQSFWHAQIADPQSAYLTAWAERILYPGLVEREAIRQAWASAPAKLAARLEEEANNNQRTSSTRLLEAPPEIPEGLDAATAEQMRADQAAKLPHGLTPDRARQLVIENRGARLWLVSDATFAAVLRTPDAATWISASASWDAARRRGKGCIDAADPFVLDAVKWSSEPLTGGAGILDRHPALFFDLWAAYKLAGGEGAAARTFRL